MVDRIANLSSLPGPSDQSILDEISRFTASSVLQITYARRASTPDDRALKDLETVSQNIADAFTPGKYWVEEFPLLDMFPSVISPWKRRLNADHDFEMKLFRDLLHGLESKLDGERRNSGESIFDPQSAIGEGVISPEECAAAELLQNRGHLKLDRDDICYLAAGIFEAGTETTAMTIDTFLLAAASYPNMIRKAQAEIDLIMDRKQCRGEAVPTFEDLQHMPYLAAVVKETLRLTPTGSSGVGHTSIRVGPQSLELNNGGDEESMQLHIPSGATVLANTYGLHHNPHHFPNPWNFDPDRWLPSDARFPSNSQDFASPTVSLDHTNAHYSFGFGRRICPGSTLASYSLSISIAMFLLCFDFELTDSGRKHYIEMERQQQEEQGKWKDLFPDPGRDIIQEGLLSNVYDDEPEQMGRLLIDAHIAFKLSRSQLAECIRLQPRKQDHGVTAVRESLAAMQNS